MKKLSKEAMEIVKNLQIDGFDLKAIHAAMGDGGYLASAGMDQETAEEISDYCSNPNLYE